MIYVLEKICRPTIRRWLFDPMLYSSQMILLYFDWQSFLGCFVMLSFFLVTFVMYLLHLADKVGISSPMCSWPEMEKSNLRLGQWTVKNTNVRREKVSSKILLEGRLSNLVKEKYRKSQKRKRPSWWFQRKAACTSTLVREKIDEKNTEKKRYVFRGSLLVHPGHTPSLNDLKRLRQLVLDLLNNQK